MQLHQEKSGTSLDEAGPVGGDSRPGQVVLRRRPDGSLVPIAVRPLRRIGSERGMVSAEWAVAIIAAISLAGVVIMIVGSGPVKDALLKFILLVIKQFSAVAGI